MTSPLGIQADTRLRGRWRESMTHFIQTQFGALGWACAGAAGGILISITLGLLHPTGVWPWWLQSFSSVQIQVGAAAVLLAGATLAFGEDAHAKYHDDAQTHEVDP